MAFTALAVAASVRHNGISAALPFAAWSATILLSRTARRWQLALVTLSLLAALFGTSRVVTTSLAERPTTFPAQQIALRDLAGISAATGLTFTPARYLASHPACVGQTLAEAYRKAPVNVCWLVFCAGAPCPPATDPEAVAAVDHDWRAAVQAAPEAWFLHRLGLWRALVGAVEGPVYYPFHRGVDANELGVTARPTALTGPAFAALDAMKDCLVFRGWVWLLAAALVAVVGWRQHRPELVLMPVNERALLCAGVPAYRASRRFPTSLVVRPEHGGRHPAPDPGPPRAGHTPGRPCLTTLLAAG